MLLVKTSALFVLWVLLSARFDVLHLGLGLLMAFLVAWINAGHSRETLRVRVWVNGLLYVPWLLTRIVASSIHVARLILDPALPIHPRLIQYESALRESPALALLGNSITLTPGTITAELQGHVLTVHAMDDQSAQDVLTKRIERRVADVFHTTGPTA